MEINLTSVLNHNSLILIDGLGTGDLQTARHLYDVVRNAHGESAPTYAQLRVARSRESLLELLRMIAQQCANGLRPALHIDAHGVAEDGLHLGDIGELLTWADLVGALEKVNVAAENNLAVVIASCYGLHAIKFVDMMRPCPFFLLIAPEDEVAAGFIADRFPRFYAELHDSRSYTSALRHLKPEFTLFLAEKVFSTAFGRYLLNHVFGPRGDNRIEELVTKVLDANPGRSRREIRRHVKAVIKNLGPHYKRYGRVFLHGRNPPPFQDIAHLARLQAQTPGRRRR